MSDKSEEEIKAEAEKKQEEQWVRKNLSDEMCIICKNRKVVKNGLCSECCKTNIVKDV